MHLKINFVHTSVQCMGHVQIHPHSKSTQSNLRTAYQSRVCGNSDSEKKIKKIQKFYKMN